ncbi:MAG: polysaccharide deacetylase family protein [Pirellulales bacterium]
MSHFLGIRGAGLAAIVCACSAAFGTPADTVVMTWQGGALAAISLTHDDNRWDHIYLCAPALTVRRLPGTFFVNPRRWRGPTWADQYGRMAREGHELGSHTMGHRQCTIVPAAQDPKNLHFHSLDELRQDCVDAKAILDRLQAKGRPTVSFAYPGGQNDAAAVEVVASQFLSARTSTTFLINPASPPSLYALKAVYVGDREGKWEDYGYAHAKLREYLDTVLKKKGWAIEEYHSIVTREIAWLNLKAYHDHLDDLVNERNAGRLWVATQGDVARYIRSRNAARIATTVNEANRIELNVDDQLPRKVFDVDLTLRTEIPAAWGANVSVTHNQRPVLHQVRTENGLAYVFYSVLADGTPIEIAPKPETSSLNRGVVASSLAVGISLLAGGWWWRRLRKMGACSLA